MPLVLRQTKGSLLTIAEMDGNLTYLEELAQPAYINYFDFSSAAVTTISVTDTWYKLNTTTTSSFSRNGLAHTNNRVTNTSSGSKVCKLEGVLSVSAGNNDEVHAAFFKSGVLFPCSEQEAVMGSGGKNNAIPFHCVAELNTNDYVEVWVKNASNTTNITLDNVNVIVTEL